MAPYTRQAVQPRSAASVPNPKNPDMATELNIDITNAEIEPSATVIR
jgi:hypothetical protein